MSDYDPLFPAIIQFGEFQMDRRLRCLWRNSERVKLAAKPFALLEFLILNHDRVVSKDVLLEKVWGERRQPNVVEQTIRQLRLALKADQGDTTFIVTVPSTGYRFVARLGFPPEISPGQSVPDAAAAGVLPLPATEVTVSDSPPPPSEDKDVGEVGPGMGCRWTTYSTAASLAVLCAGAFLFATAPGDPVSCEVAVNTLIVKDGQGREVWRNEFAEHLNERFYAERGPLCQFADLNGDGKADVLFAERSASSDFDSDTLFEFITRSRMLRRFMPTPARALTFVPGANLVVGPNSDPTIRRPYDEYLPPYEIHGIFIQKTTNSQPLVIVASGMNQAPEQIAVLTSELRRISEYWHSGHLDYGQFSTYSGSSRIFLAGVNNGYRSATLIAFDPNNIRGTSDLSVNLPGWTPKFAIIAAGSRNHLAKLGTGTETCRVLFERTCVAKAKPHLEPYNRVSSLKVSDDRIVVTVAEGERIDTPETVVYEMDRHLNLVEVAPNTKFRQRHFELERAGLLDHPFSPEELKPLVHVLPGCEFVITTP